MTWGKRKGKAARKIQRHRCGAESLRRSFRASTISAFRRFTQISLGVLTVLALSPVIPLPRTANAVEGSTNEAFEGTVDYSDFFTIEDRIPEVKVGSINGSVLRAATTEDPSYYGWVPAQNRHTSGSAFVSCNRIPLSCSWRVEGNVQLSKPTRIAATTGSRAWLSFSFSDTSNANKANGPGLFLQRINMATGSFNPQQLIAIGFVGGNATQHLGTAVQVPEAECSDVVFEYDSASDTMTLRSKGTSTSTWNTVSYSGIRSQFASNNPFFIIMGNISWSNTTNPSIPQVPSTDMRVNITFDSISLPHLTPTISDVAIFDLDGNPLNKEDVVEPNAIVQVRCKVQNINPNAGSETYGMHLKLATADTEYKTRGITPFFSAEYPMLTRTGNASTWSDVTAIAASDFNDGTGVPLTLTGRTPVEVTYYAHVNQSVSESVMLGQALIEDTFQGTHYEKAELLSQKTLMPGDTDDPTLVPGTDYHYTRLPAANENGWNGKATSPVDVTFYAGDFDEFTVTQNAGQSVLSTLAGGQKWTQAADVDSLPVTYQARNTSSGGTSSKGADVIRIDTHEPALSYDAATGTLTAGDAAPAGSGKAASGIWRIERVKADGRPLAAQDVTPRGDAVQALAGGTAAAPSASAGQASWVFPLADGKGQPAQSVPSAQPGFYAATDAAGNVSAVLEVKAATDPDEPGPDDPDPDKPGPDDPDPDNPDPGKPDNPGDNPNPSTPTFPTVTPKPGNGPDNPVPDPLKPTHVETDPSTGLSHATVQDAITIPTSPDKVTTAMMAQLIDKRYTVTSSLGDSRITAGPVRLLDAAGNPTDAIDRTRPGTWYAEQTFTDAAGNTTTIRLTITVRDSLIDGTIGTIDNGNSSAGAGTNGDGGGEGHRTALANRISRLPQTGGIFGPCPLHILFALMAVMASAYSLARLRQNRISRDRKRQREEQSATARTGSRDGLADGCTGQLSAGECEHSGLSPFDALVYGFIALCALAVGFLALCPWDMLLAVLTVLVCVLWGALLHHRRPAGASREEPAFR